MRHGFAALVLAALLVPLAPVGAPTMACCKGGREACACPLELGFSRCQPSRDIAAPHFAPALLPPPSPELALAPTPEPLGAPSDRTAIACLSPSVPPPRA